MICANVSAASATDWSMDKNWVTTRRRWRSHLSTSTPANGARIRVGICPKKPTMPSRNTEPLSRYTSQLVAMRVIQVPTSETVWPLKKSR